MALQYRTCLIELAFLHCSQWDSCPDKLRDYHEHSWAHILRATRGRDGAPRLIKSPMPQFSLGIVRSTMMWSGPKPRGDKENLQADKSACMLADCSITSGSSRVDGREAVAAPCGRKNSALTWLALTKLLPEAVGGLKLCQNSRDMDKLSEHARAMAPYNELWDKGGVGAGRGRLGVVKPPGPLLHKSPSHWRRVWTDRNLAVQWQEVHQKGNPEWQPSGLNVPPKHTRGITLGRIPNTSDAFYFFLRRFYLLVPMGFDHQQEGEFCC